MTAFAARMSSRRSRRRIGSRRSGSPRRARRPISASPSCPARASRSLSAATAGMAPMARGKLRNSLTSRRRSSPPGARSWRRPPDARRRLCATRSLALARAGRLLLGRRRRESLSLDARERRRDYRDRRQRQYGGRGDRDRRAGLCRSAAWPPRQDRRLSRRSPTPAPSASGAARSRTGAARRSMRRPTSPAPSRRPIWPLPGRVLNSERPPLFCAALPWQGARLLEKPAARR